MSTVIPVIVIVIVALLAFVAGVLIARRKGYTSPREVVVRCRRGHLFITVWVASASTHRLDLGWARVQRCPVGNHLTLVVPVKDSDLTSEQRRVARQNRDEAAG
jgi:hypothetical protein